MAEASAVTLLLMKTGSTAWEDEGRLCGSTDLPMSELGQAAFEASLESLSADHVDTVYCGPDEGSLLAGQLIVARHGGRKRVIEALGEVSLGLWEGQRREDLMSRHPKAYKQWSEDPASVLPPEGESIGEARERIVGELCRLIEKARGGSHRIAFVLRPMAAAITDASLADTMGGEPVQNGTAGWRTVWCERVRELRATCRAGVA